MNLAGHFAATCGSLNISTLTNRLLQKVAKKVVARWPILGVSRRVCHSTEKDLFAPGRFQFPNPQAEPGRPCRLVGTFLKILVVGDLGNSEKRHTGELSIRGPLVNRVEKHVQQWRWLVFFSSHASLMNLKEGSLKLG